MGGRVKRAGIVTPYGLTNYGNRLQNYAVQAVLSDRGREASTFILKRRYVLGNLVDAIRHIRAYAFWWDMDCRRYRRFCQFERQMRRKRFWSRRQLDRTKDGFDCFVVGSDQIWNPHFVTLEGPQFLDWAYKQQRICLAPSFGVSEIPPQDRAAYSRWLNGFGSISVREEAGALIVKELTGRDATVLIDPTLVLDDADWRAIASDALRPRVPYALTYFLGERSASRRAYIEDFAKSHDLVVINLLDRSDPKTYCAGPREFLDLIDHAACVFTDSFHGSAFSLIFDVPVVIFEREDEVASMSSRVETLARTFGLEGRLYSPDKHLDVLDTDYAHAKHVLRDKRAEFLCFLDEQLERSDSHPGDKTPEHEPRPRP